MNRAMNMNLVRWLTLALLSILLMIPFGIGQVLDDGFDPSRWEKDIQAFEKKDQAHFPQEQGIVFAGSSSIRKWDLNKSFPKMNVINRGFGGSHMEDILYYARRIVIPYNPKIVVVYEGDNDIKDGKSPGRVFSDFKKFVRAVRSELPETRIVFIAIKPSIKRWNLVDRMREANQLIKLYTEGSKYLDYVDIDTPMLGENGKPRKSLFADDDLHLSDEGYALWASEIVPYLKESRTS